MKKEGRFHIRVPTSLREQMKSYAERHHTTINAIVEQFFVALLRDEQRGDDVEVGEQA